MDSSKVSSGRASSAARTAVVWEALTAELARLAEEFVEPLNIVDAGGGTGGAAVPLARLGHRVTVVDSSPDSLAALERRAAEAGVRVNAVQGDAEGLRELLPEASAHLVLVHNVVEHVDDPLTALRDVVSITQPRGANAVAAVLHRALAGHLADALALLQSNEGRWGPSDPMPRRYTAEQLTALVREAGLEVHELRGVRILGDLLPGRVFEDPQTPDTLLAVEKAASAHAELSRIATQLHVMARRPA